MLLQKHIIYPTISGVLTAILVGIISLAYLNDRKNHEDIVLREDLKNRAFNIKSIIESSVKDKFYLSKVIASYVEINPNIDKESFTEFTKEVYQISRNGLQSIQLVKDSIIKFNYPELGNEKTVGVNVNALLNDRVLTDSSRKNRTPLIIGPRVLLQGKMGFVYRHPIVIEDTTNKDSTKLWGYSAVVVDLKNLFEKVSEADSGNVIVGLISVKQSLSKNGYFYGDSSILELKHIEIPIELPNDEWKLQVGIKDTTPLLFSDLSLQVFFLLFSILIGVLAAFLSSAVLQIYKSNNTLNKSNQNIKNQLNEKSAIILEIHHRIKNHFQMISSLNRITYQNVENNEVQKAISDINNRIGTLATAYSQLNESNDYQSEMNIYIPTLAENLISSMAGDIELILNIEDIKLGIKKTVSLGVIINEMIINSLKHGFPIHQKGTIKISLKATNNEITITYLENGIGLPPDILQTHSESTGIFLIQTFIDQLNGHINQINEGEWTGFYLSFPLNEPY
tara:strand:- start:902 stop:2428 length:1527 start_codon:yes stop_codon:yes gene_type:complete